jgi:hypothetical protein
VNAAASDEISPVTSQISPLLTASAFGFAAVGVATGLVWYLHRSPVREAHEPGTSAWLQQLILGAMACHYLDAGLIITACAWLLDWILLPATADGRRP